MDLKLISLEKAFLTLRNQVDTCLVVVRKEREKYQVEDVDAPLSKTKIQAKAVPAVPLLKTKHLGLSRKRKIPEVIEEHDEPDGEEEAD